MKEPGIYLSVDYLHDRFAAVLWNVGDIVAAFTYVHSSPTDLYSNNVTVSMQREIADKCLQWNSDFGEIKEAVFDSGVGTEKLFNQRKAARNWKDFRIQWHIKARDGLVAGVEPYCSIIFIDRDEMYYPFSGELIARYKNAIGSDKRRHVLRRAICCGVQAGFYQQAVEKAVEKIEDGEAGPALKALIEMHDLPVITSDDIKKAINLANKCIIFAKNDQAVRRFTAVRDGWEKLFKIELQDQRAEIEAIKRRLKKAGVK